MHSEEGNEGIGIHAGFPNPATDKSLLTLDLNSLLVTRPASTFLFRISGNEWTDLGIFNQDIALVDRAAVPSVNDLVIWWGEQGRFNISKIQDAASDSTIWGVVTTVIHQYRRSKKV